MITSSLVPLHPGQLGGGGQQPVQVGQGLDEPDLLAAGSAHPDLAVVIHVELADQLLLSGLPDPEEQLVLGVR